MNTNSKVRKTLSASSLTKLDNKHATRAQPAEKTSGTSRHTRKVIPSLKQLLTNTMCYQMKL